MTYGAAPPRPGRSRRRRRGLRYGRVPSGHRLPNGTIAPSGLGDTDTLYLAHVTTDGKVWRPETDAEKRKLMNAMNSPVTHGGLTVVHGLDGGDGR